MAKTKYFKEKTSQNAGLVLFHKSGIIATYRLGFRNSVGRSSLQGDCSINIRSKFVSRMHGEIAVIDGEYFYKDLNSTNGTYINDTLLGRKSPENRMVKKLQDGDILCFGICRSDIDRADSVYGLFTMFGETKCEWNSLELRENIAEICIGRSVQSGLQIGSDMISERHASFFCSANGWAIIDHQSTNGVYLNGKRVSEPRYLKAFDVIRIVDKYFIFTGEYLLFSGGVTNLDERAAPQVKAMQSEDAAPWAGIASPVKEAPSAGIVPSVRQSAVSASQKHQGRLVINITERSVIQRFKKMLLLQDINLSVPDGDMVLILGGSGAGKTTFVNAVMGYEKASGKIMYKDTDIYAEYEQMKYEIGFVPQQDLLRGSDTVYDTLSNAAEMKLPKRMSYEAREERISNVLEELGLSRERETLVSKLSGGQRKRLSIAVEFIANPSLFFLDEPDSGVDDIMGRGLMENLRAIADQGKIVMVITHSPERAADLFDKVIVLAKSTKDNCGHLAFFGPVEEAFRFFEVSSFREIVKKINRPDENGEGLSDFFIDKYIAYNRG